MAIASIAIGTARPGRAEPARRGLTWDMQVTGGLSPWVDGDDAAVPMARARVGGIAYLEPFALAIGGVGQAGGVGTGMLGGLEVEVAHLERGGWAQAAVLADGDGTTVLAGAGFAFFGVEYQRRLGAGDQAVYVTLTAPIGLGRVFLGLMAR
jgi:hypothetical protein